MYKFSAPLLIALLLFSSSVFAQIARDLQVTTANSFISQENTDELRLKYEELQQQLYNPINHSTRYYEGEYLGAIQFPVGGIGGGCIQYDGTAAPRYWQIFNNMTHDAVQHSFMAVRVKQGENVVVRALQTTDIEDFKGMQLLKMKSEFPFIDYIFSDEAILVNITLRIYNPFIPLNIKDSSIPAAFYQVFVDNNSSEDVSVSLLAVQQNAVGLSRAGKVKEGDSFAEGLKNSLERKLMTGNKSAYYGGNFNRVVNTQHATTVIMESTITPEDEHYGQMALMLLDHKGNHLQQSNATARWDGMKKLYSTFEKRGTIEEIKNTRPSRKGETYSAAICTSVELKEGESDVFELVLAWNFPNGKNGGYNGDKWDAWGGGRWEGKGNYYANHWDDINSLTNYITNENQRLYSESRMFQESFFDTTLPYWLRERLSSQLAILKSRTLFYDSTGYIGLWEGAGSVDGSCSGNCNHVWHYAQSHARLFPSLGRAAREQGFRMIKPNGQIPYRQPAGSDAFDGQCGDILATYREHLLCEDNAWLISQYPHVKQAINYLINTWDEDEDGWLQGKMHTTYDCSMSGNASFLTSLYLATLKAGEEMAKICNDNIQEKKWKELATKGMKVQNERLWNGEYYNQIPDTANRASDYENACHSDQLLGQWWADQLGLGDLFPQYRMKQSFNAILKHNFKSTLQYHKQKPRSFALKNEPGLIVSTWPYNDRPQNAPGYSDEIWSTYEYTIASSLLKQGQADDALTLLLAGAMRYDGKLRTGFTDAWGNFGFTGNPFGDDECGQFYSRALAQWSVLLAAQGFHFDGPKQILAFSPTWNKENHASFFSTAKGWGNFTQQQQGAQQTNTLTLKYGTLKLKTLIIDNLSLVSERKTTLTLNGNRLAAKATVKGKNLHVEMIPEIQLKNGDKLVIIQD